jgi:hypothetical protein
MDVTEIKEIYDLNKKRFSSTSEMYGFIMEELQSHWIEVDDLKKENDPHYQKEIADLAILAKLLALCEDVDDSIFSERYERFKEKIKENSRK